MGKRIFTKEWYTPDKILGYSASYNIVIGMRSNGKTYAIKKRIIDRIKDENIKFIYMRREHTHITRQKMVKLFGDINEYAYKKLGGYINYGAQSGFYYIDDNGIEHTIGYAVSVEDAYQLKGIPYDEIKIILFDEFIDIKYMENEIPLFLHMISTICRGRNDIEKWMLGNTISKSCPYFELFGINPHELKQGHIYYGEHKLGVTFAIEWCLTKSADGTGTVKNTSVGFDNNATTNMILFGEWEYSIVNTRSIDGRGWSEKRMIIPCYITHLEEVFELSFTKDDNPIGFVRKINSQKGKVNRYIKYNLSVDNTLTLVNSNGIVPTHGKITPLMDEQTTAMLKLFYNCILAKRIVFDKISTGSDFMKIYKGVF